MTDGSFVYRALSELESDGAWVTWLGEQRDASGGTRPVLLKHTGESNRTRAGAEALWLEALLTLKLDGPQVVPLLDHGVLDGRPFAVYGFEEGVLLAQVLEGLRERGRRLPSGVAVGIILQACEALKRLHKVSLEDAPAGFVHGALSPRNLMLTERGDVKVLGLVGARPIGRVVGRENVSQAAVAYASPELLGGAPVTPAVDVFSLGAVLSELLGDGSGDTERDELALIVRQLLQNGATGGFNSVEAFAGALQDAVRRTGTVVARQSIGAQVRGVCEQYLLERRRQVRVLREASWGDLRAPQSSRSLAAAGGQPNGASAPSPDELEAMQAAEEEAPALGEYSEEASDDAVTRIFDGELESEGAAQPQAWMHDSRPAEAARSGWSRWVVVTLLSVLVAVASGAAFMASRSVARTPAPVASRDVQAAAAPRAEAVEPEKAMPTAGREDTAAGEEGRAAAEVAPAAIAAAIQEAVPAESDESDEPEALERATSEAAGSSSEGNRAEAKRASVAPRRAAAPRRARPEPRAPSRGAPSPTAVAAAQRPAAAGEVEARQAEPATIAADELPEATEEDEPAQPAPARAPAAAAADGDLVIEEAPRMAFLSVDATPYATIYIDGEKKGITPLVRIELAPGLHRMIARTEDGRTKRYTLQLEPGKTETVKVPFEE